VSSKCEGHRIGHLLTLDEARHLSYYARGAPRWEELELFDEFRLRDALKKLHQMPLITCNDGNDSYSMHPLIYTWVRERPEMSTAEQACRCHVAATTLAQAILLPPLGSAEVDEDL
jgi:hypothetical protein